MVTDFPEEDDQNDMDLVDTYPRIQINEGLLTQKTTQAYKP